MSETFSDLGELPMQAPPSTNTTKPLLLTAEPLPESACPEMSTTSSSPDDDLSSSVVKEALIPLPISPTSSTLTLDEYRCGITERQENGFLRRWQRWESSGEYWTSSEYVEETPEAATEPNFFYLNVRHKSDDEKPDLVLSHFSPILLACLRTVVNDKCSSKRPEIVIDELFLKLEALNTRMDAARVALEKGNDEDSVIQSAKALGHEGPHADDDARKYLTAATQQLESLLLLLKEEFKPIGERLEHAIANGRMSRDLLGFYFREGQKYYYLDDNDDFQAFRLTSTNDNESEQTFTLNGEGSFWNGTKWVKLDRVRVVKLSEGSPVSLDLLATKMTPEMCGRFTERGRKYRSLAGVHYRIYRGRRIMIDRLAWNTFGYVHSEESTFPFPLLQDRSKARINHEIPSVPEEDIDLLPQYIPGFDLERKSWTSFEVDEVMPINFNNNAWKHIVLEESLKTMIEEVVSAFDFTKEVMEGEEEVGLVVLLYGPSGTGKTATVEAIAEHLMRPLYSLPVSTLPFDMTVLGDTLMSRLETTRTWNAIILIEAGDILMQTQGQNEPTMMDDLIRISTILEFFQRHRCIVFVTARTTNPLYMSHFALTIQYHELDADSRQTLWSNMLSGEGSNISHRDIEELSRVAVNGRAMRNIHNIAKVLARSSKQPLSLHHLKIAAKAQGQVEGAGYNLYL